MVVYTLRDQPGLVCAVAALPAGGLDPHGGGSPHASGAELWKRRVSMLVLMLYIYSCVPTGLGLSRPRYESTSMASAQDSWRHCRSFVGGGELERAKLEFCCWKLWILTCVDLYCVRSTYYRVILLETGPQGCYRRSPIRDDWRDP